MVGKDNPTPEGKEKSRKIKKKKPDNTAVLIRAMTLLFNFIYRMGYEKGVTDARSKFINDIKEAFKDAKK